ncbi:Arabinose metabolism transcriptional repressor [Planctomycetes bacterium MalM25]|nr:Arabinose metabolism transcriptional repressor [Planctomycetes bacterium MalM25]
MSAEGPLSVRTHKEWLVSVNNTKQRHVYETVRRRIEAGDFQPGDRIPSDSELVREFGVSRPTVAKALRELERAGMVRRKTGSGTYVLDVAGAEGQQFGLLIPGLGETEIFEPICASMARVAQLMGHGLVWGANATHAPSFEKGRQAIALCERYLQDGVGGIFFAPLEHVDDKDQVNARIISLCESADVPVVLLDRDLVPYPERSDHDLVGIDNRRVGYAVTHHLFQQGCERVMFFARPGSAATIDARIAGFMEAVVKDAGSFDAKLVQRCDPKDREAIGAFFASQRPDGIVCGNDVTAGHLMHTLDQMGLDVPDDVLVAGIDDVKYAELLRVPLTTVRQPCEALGEAAFRTMIDRIDVPNAPARDVLLGCELIERESTKRIKETAR